MHIVTLQNADEVAEARRDVLAMFADIAEEGGRLSDANVWVRFDPLRFVDASDDGKFNYGDIEFLRVGSAVSILCDFYDRWEEEQPLLDSRTTPFVEAIREGRLSFFPDIAELVVELLNRSDHATSVWLNAAIEPIYRKYVQAFFKALSAEGVRP